jgi:exopolysaccharide biosynthesis predicted pyruvyltransferase EpsI
VFLKNLRTESDYSTLASIIKQKSVGRKLFYVPNSGNWGDGLINEGTIQFLTYHKITFKLLDRRTFVSINNALEKVDMRLSGSVLLAGGGGAWCNNYSASRQFVDMCGKLFDHVIVLPTTFELPPVQLPTERITYFRRDEYQSSKNSPVSLFCHDMAFFLSYDIHIPAARFSLGNFFREDEERNAVSVLPSDNLDISDFGHANKNSLQFFRILSNYERIRTDRMHVAIASCLLGIDCELFPGNYFKSRALFHSSIQPHYQTCSFRPWQ